MFTPDGSVNWISNAATVASAAALLATGAAAGFLSARRLARNPQRPAAKAAQGQPWQNALPARLDPLTGLATRAGFYQAIGNALASGEAHGVFLLNINDFSSLNATIGHTGGDRVLVAVAERLASIGFRAQWARVGADEFGLVLPSFSTRDDVEAIALAILRSFVTPIVTVERTLYCSASLGVALLPAHATNTDGILKAASAALARARVTQGGGWYVYDPSMDHAIHQRAALKEELREGIANNRIVPYYQPIVELRTGEITGLEVLARWQHPERGLLPPDLFVPMAEEMHLADQLTQMLMRQVVRDSRYWSPKLKFAFNVSPCQLRELISMVLDPPYWPEGSLDPTRLEIEITESALIEDLELARELIDLLQARGTSVVLDDFGIGYSNFLHLRELPFNRLKIDKSFILDCPFDPRADACIRAMLAVAENLEIDMVAEGLETPEMATYVASLGCRYGQGYLFSKPVPAGEVAGLFMPHAVRARVAQEA
jgi:diguanylate cyclase (GGDEF)-like protein